MLGRRTLSKEKDIRDLLTQPSAYSEDGDGTIIEGVYLKINDRETGKYVEHRCKVVRGNFLSGNEHWSKRLDRNKLGFDAYSRK